MNSLRSREPVHSCVRRSRSVYALSAAGLLGCLLVAVSCTRDASRKAVADAAPATTSAPSRDVVSTQEGNVQEPEPVAAQAPPSNVTRTAPSPEAPAAAVPQTEAKPAPKEEASKRKSADAFDVGNPYEGSGAALGGSSVAPSRRAAGVPRASVGHGRLGGAHALRSRPAPAPTAAPFVEREFNTESYAHIAENRFLKVSEHPQSTFSIDVDTASYSNARRFLTQGQLPPKDAIRVEEWVNYFGYQYTPPSDAKTPFSVHSEVSVCPWNADHRLVKIGLKGKPIADEKAPARNLVFLVDVSGSMSSPDKLPLVKQGLGLLARNLRTQDKMSIVVYAGASGLVLPATRGDKRGEIMSALGSLESGGSTNGGAGIQLAYNIAQQNFIKGGINRVILATDGDFNVGTTSEGELVRLIEDKRKSGVFLTVLGFGTGNYKDSMMEKLADKGNGNYAYVDSLSEAHKVLVREAGSTLITIAKDVKLQVEFNPARVASYKLIGYENRVLAKEDFNDDKKDAGEIGAGHSVTALYEVVPKGVPLPSSAPATDPLKYQSPGALSAAAQADEIMTVNLRYKPPTSDTSTKLSHVIKDTLVPLSQTSQDFRFAAAVANAALLLRGSADVKKSSFDSVRKLAQAAVGSDLSGERHEFLRLLDSAARLSAPARVSQIAQ